MSKQKSWLAPVAVVAAFAGLYYFERHRPLRHQRAEPDYQRVPKNLALAAVVALEVNLCERPLVAQAARWVEEKRIGLLPRLGLGSVAEQVVGLILLDYTLYWWHVLLHKLPCLWRSHRVHHSDLALDSTTAFRFHAFEFIASIPWRLAQVVVIGVRPSTLLLWQRLTLLEVLFHHSNVRLPERAEKWLGRIIVTPSMHGIHHSVVPQEMHSNYSSGLSIWDRIHRTLKTDVEQGHIKIGVDDCREPQSLATLLSLPFRRK